MKFLHRCTGTHARVHVHFLRRECIHFDRCCEHHAHAGVYVRQVLWTSEYTFCVHACYWMCICAHVCAVCSFRVGERGWWGPISVWGHLLLRGLFLTEGEIGVLSVSSLFLTRMGVYVGVGVCIRTHTHTLHIWSTRVWDQESIWDTLRARKKSRHAKFWHICIRICVPSTHLYIYARRRDEILD